MVNENLRYEIWEKYYSAMCCARFYEVLAGRYARYRNFVRCLWMLPMFSALVVSADLLPDHAGSILILIVVMIIALSILDLTLNLTDNSIKLSLTNKECSKLEDEWMKLWLNANSDEVDESRVGEKHFALVERFTATTIDVDDAIIYRNRRLNLKCEEIVHEYMANKYRYA